MCVFVHEREREREKAKVVCVCAITIVALQVRLQRNPSRMVLQQSADSACHATDAVGLVAFGHKIERGTALRDQRMVPSEATLGTCENQLQLHKHTLKKINIKT